LAVDVYFGGNTRTFIFCFALFCWPQPAMAREKGFYNEALQVITQTNPGSNHKIILEEIKQSINTEVVDHMKYLFKKPYLRLVIIGLLVGMFNQFTGIAVVMIYSSDIFRAAGFGTESAILQTVIVGATNLAFTILAMAFIDRIGRKFMLLLGSVGMTVFLAIFSYIFLAGIGGFMPLFFMISLLPVLPFRREPLFGCFFPKCSQTIYVRGVLQ
jgi:hypothetical protein